MDTTVITTTGMDMEVMVDTTEDTSTSRGRSQDDQDDPTPPGIAPDCGFSGIYWPKCVDWFHVKPEDAWGQGGLGYGLSKDVCYKQGRTEMIAKCRGNYDNWEMNESLKSQY